MSQSRAEWEETSLRPFLKRFPERQARFTTPSGLEVHALYAPEDVKPDYSSVGYPGEFPFTRGIQPTMYRGRLWTMRQYAGFASAEESNKRYKYLLSQGQTGLSIAFDLPSQMGYDSDHPLARGEAGKVGVPISSLADMEALFQDIPLDQVSSSMTINATAPILLAMYIALAQKQGIGPKALEGTIQNDILKEYVARGNYIFPPRPSMRLTVDILEYCARHLPRWNPISMSGYHIREAGATATQELGFTLAHGIAYVQAAMERGLEVDSFASRLSFFFAAHNSLFEEVAKFRAARRLWARIMKERFGARDPRSWMLRFHTQTAGSTLTAQQPHNNIVRTTIQALAAVLGGTQSLHTNSWDEAYATPGEEAVTIALRTQQVMAHESGVADTADPLGGSYLVESLTDRIEAEARKYIERIDSLGGAVAAVEQGFEQREIQEASYRYQQEMEKGERVVVGVNKFFSPFPKITGTLRVSPQDQQRRLARLAEVKAKRDQAKAQACLKRLEEVARGGENTMPAILEAVEAYCTVGEICAVLRGVFGTQQELLVL
jgi:methylmalonyl-CoA mutase N-terminal domain/subunit